MRLRDWLPNFENNNEPLIWDTEFDDSPPHLLSVVSGKSPRITGLKNAEKFNQERTSDQ